jgi:hypothetical protein
MKINAFRYWKLNNITLNILILKLPQNVGNKTEPS